jgi:hypothetical protein
MCSVFQYLHTYLQMWDCHAQGMCLKFTYVWVYNSYKNQNGEIFVANFLPSCNSFVPFSHISGPVLYYICIFFAYTYMSITCIFASMYPIFKYKQFSRINLCAGIIVFGKKKAVLLQIPFFLSTCSLQFS